MANGVSSAVATLRELLAADQEVYIFSLFELLDLCEDLMKADRPDDAEALYSALLESFDPTRIQYGYAQILANHGEVERAISLLDALEGAGEAIDLPAALDFLYYDLPRRGRTEDAIRVLQARIERFPDSYHAYCYLARLYADRGDLDLARAAVQTAMGLNPDWDLAREVLEELNQTRR